MLQNSKIKVIRNNIYKILEIELNNLQVIFIYFYYVSQALICNSSIK